jgi:hypothetical protein
MQGINTGEEERGEGEGYLRTLPAGCGVFPGDKPVFFHAVVEEPARSRV